LCARFPPQACKIYTKIQRDVEQDFRRGPYKAIAMLEGDVFRSGRNVTSTVFAGNPPSLLLRLAF
jgi:hypothetical protein